MDIKILFRRKAISFTLLGGLIFGGCIYDPLYIGPPPHAHYQPHSHDYYFYPSVGVYFHFTSGFYFYLHNRRWIRSRVLPSHIHIDPHDRIRLRIDSDRPYLKHEYYQKQYKTRPDFRYNRERSLKEREANRKWYREYEQRQKKHDDKDWKKRK